MNIKTKLYKPFTKEVKKLKKKYGEEFEKLNGFHNSNLNFTDFIDNFTKQDTLADVTIDANANNYMKDMPSMTREINKPSQKLLSYNKIFYEMVKKYGMKDAKEWLKKEWNGEFYMHNAHTSSYIPYCYAYSLEDLAKRGLFFLGKFKTTGAKHLDSFNNHTLEFISYASNRVSGAVGLADVLIWQYFFYQQDKKNGYMGITDWEKYRDQQFQTFIYNLNQPYLRVTESSFTNISIYDRNYLVKLFGETEFPDGTFGIEHIDDILDFQKAFMEKCSQVRMESMMTYPVLTFCLLFQNGKFVDEETARWANKHNMKWNDSNFYLGQDIDTLSSCCRVLNNIKEMDNHGKNSLGFINSIGGTSLKVGSVQVNTTNLHRLALMSKGNMEEFRTLLINNINLSMKVLDIVRGIIKRNIEKGLLPMYSYKLIEIERQFATIGITGMYSTIETFGEIIEDDFGNKTYSEKGKEIACEIMDIINSMKDKFTKEYLFNLENVPGESCNVKLARKDALLYGFSAVGTNIYGNQWIPLTEKCTNKDKIALSALLDVRAGGGQILHVNLEERFVDEEQSWDMLNHIARSGVIYFAYNIKINACEDNHGFFGEKCHCGKPPVETYSRVVGFIVPYSSFSKERKQEFNNRLWYSIGD